MRLLAEMSLHLRSASACAYCATLRLVLPSETLLCLQRQYSALLQHNWVAG